MSTPSIPIVLYVDDEQSNLSAFEASFRKYYKIYTASSVIEAQKILSEIEIHILLTDQRMPGQVGTTLLEYSVANYPRQVRILISAFADNTVLASAV